MPPGETRLVSISPAPPANLNITVPMSSVVFGMRRVSALRAS
jgi:hypothetical protein